MYKENSKGMRRCDKILKVLLLHWLPLFKMGKKKKKHLENKSILRSSQSTRILFIKDKGKKEGTESK